MDMSTNHMMKTYIAGGMFVSLVERPDDLVKLINDMDPETRRLSQSFCGIGDGQ